MPFPPIAEKPPHEKAMSQELKLLALDAEDLNVISAHAQDAVLSVGDIDFSPSGKRLLIAMNRFVWESPASRRRLFKKHERRRSVLHVEKVRAVRSAGLDRQRPETVLSLLAITFEQDEAGNPAGSLIFDFAGGASLQADVECVEMRFLDIGGAWSATRRPRHPGPSG